VLLDAGADLTATSLGGDTVLAATEVPWDVTEYVANLLDIPIEREAVTAGRRDCAELLNLVLAESNDPAVRLLAAIATNESQGVREALATEVDLETRSGATGSTPPRWPRSSAGR